MEIRGFWGAVLGYSFKVGILMTIGGGILGASIGVVWGLANGELGNGPPGRVPSDFLPYFGNSPAVRLCRSIFGLIVGIGFWLTVFAFFGILVTVIVKSCRKGPSRPNDKKESSSFNKRFRQITPTAYKVGGLAGRDRGCLIPALLFPGVAGPIVMLLFHLAIGQGSFMSWDDDPAGLTIALGCQIFPLIAVLILLLTRKFVFDKEGGELMAGNVLHKERYPLAAVRSVEVNHRSHDIPDTTESGEFGPDQTVSGFGIGLVLNTAERDFCLEMSFNCNLGDSVNKAEQLAEFLNVPVGGDAYEKFKRHSST